MTEPSLLQPAPAPTGGRPPDLTYDAAGRIVSRTEYQSGSGEAKCITRYEYDEYGRIVHETQILAEAPQPSPAP